MKNTIEEAIYKSRYGDIYYKLCGPRDAPMVVFVHGVGMDHRTFEEQADAIGGQYRLLMWDLPGHGNSTFKQYDQRFTHMAANCLDGLMHEAGVGKAVFVGQSLGSMIVQHFVAMHPEKVMATVHVPGIDLTDRFNPVLKILISMMLGMARMIPERIFYNSFGSHRAEKPEVQRYLSGSISRVGKEFVMRITKDMVDDLFEALPTPQKRPMLIAYGEKDLPFIRKGSLKWHRKFPYSNCIEIPEANHISNQDNPEDFNKVLVDFLGTFIK
jgi:3-oxoadipate enol-lactonase